MRIACISDTHDVYYPDLPEVDAVIHAGDISLSGSRDETLRFLRWFESLKIKHKLFIGGNHDRFLEAWGGSMLDDYPSIEMLWDSIYDLEGYRVWGSPTSAAYGHIRAFAKEREYLEESKYWDRIPQSADIVVTHGPAYGMRDQVRPAGFNSEHLGDIPLYKRLSQIAPQYHICGHIHGGRGRMIQKWANGRNTYCINAAVLNEAYRPWDIEHIEVIELPRKDEDLWGV